MTKILVNSLGKPYISSQGKALQYNESSFIVVTTNKKLATLTCGSQSYTLTGDELSHAFMVGAGTYTCTASLDGTTKSTTVTVTTANVYSVSISLSDVPAEYQEVEYIQSTGVQYLNSGIVPTVDTNVKIKAAYVGIVQGSSYDSVIGSTSGTGATARFYPFGYTYSTQNLRQTYGSVQCEQTFDTNIHEIDFNNVNKTIVVDNTIVGSTATGFEPVSNQPEMYMFATNDRGSAAWHGAVKLYSLQIYENGVGLLRNFIPAIRVFDSVVGMYETVTQTFFTNQGSGVFIAGPDVN